ncbi:MAG: TIGR01777 family oxidoreductase [Akkermansiaceae bacterium]|nr:TIGR01777 family oxidoreductase [Akkermansiaceae bacterium]
MQAPDKVLILGVTGAIGRGLPRLLQAAGYQVTGVSRRDNPQLEGVCGWQTPEALDPAGHVAVINLAGETISKRWTESNKQAFRESRVGLTRRLVKAMARLPEDQRPKVLVNGSAVGYYGDRKEEELTEDSSMGEGYLAELCRDWEAAALDSRKHGLRVVTLRTGVVLGREADAWQKLAGVIKTGLGGKLGSGRQWMPWIHVEDLRRAIVHAIQTQSISGPINGSAPAPERNADLTGKIAKAFGRPAILPVPGFALRIVVGGFASALLASTRALPKKLESHGFEFRYPTLEKALEELVD